MSNLKELIKIFDDNKDKRICVLGTTCTGKTTLINNSGLGLDMDKEIFPLLTEEETEYVCRTPWTKEIGTKMNDLVKSKLKIIPGTPMFGTVLLDCDLIVYLHISDELLLERTKLRKVNFKDAKNMQQQIEQEITSSNIKTIYIEVKNENSYIVLTSCGIINEKFKKSFYKIISKEELRKAKVLYITTASDGEHGDKSWMEEEFKTILDLGITKDNITEYKIGKSPIDINKYDILYMMGGNTFYLLDIIRKNSFNEAINNFLDSGKIYIGSSAGSEILGSSVEPAIGYDDNIVNMKDFTGLKIIDGLIIPHCNRKEDYISRLKNNTNQKLYLLYDGDGIII